MDEKEWLAARFEAHRAQLRAVAHRMLGSMPEADDAVQEAWLRLSRADASRVDNIGGWLTTAVVRVSLNMLRSRRRRREEPMGAHVPEPIAGQDAELEAMLADSIGLALLVVLRTLDPAEQLAFVLHDVFAVPFDEIAAIVGRSSTAARQLASRARRRVRAAATDRGDLDVEARQTAVDAFLAAARGGDFEALLAVLLTACPQQHSASCVQARQRWFATRAAPLPRRIREDKQGAGFASALIGSSRS
ncbi:MAG TPA: sigma-70 family RNA polymerase sigma factor [Vicinamibacterales bacterium]|nr:sigma-70 family RNA polymerase sigma factor [Vicinamibacterales bacterium]